MIFTWMNQLQLPILSHVGGLQVSAVPNNPMLDSHGRMLGSQIFQEIRQISGRSVDDGAAIPSPAVLVFNERFLDEFFGKLVHLGLSQVLDLILPHVEDLAKTVWRSFDSGINSTLAGEALEI